MAISRDHHPEEDEKKEPRAKLVLFEGAIFIAFIWSFSLIPCLFGGYYYYKFVFQPFQSQIVQIKPIFTDLTILGILLLTSIIFWGLYLLRIILAVILTRISLFYCNLRFPRKEMIGAFGVGKMEAKAVQIYFLRGVILRVLKWMTTKCAFPWIAPWAFNFTKANKFGKGTVIEDQFYCHELLETGENVHIGQGAHFSSALVEGKYGAINLKKITIGKESVISPFCFIGPGTEIGEYSEILPMSAAQKFHVLKGYSKNYGIPMVRINRKRYMNIMNLPKEFEARIIETKQMKTKNKKQPQL